MGEDSVILMFIHSPQNTFCRAKDLIASDKQFYVLLCGVTNTQWRHLPNADTVICGSPSKLTVSIAVAIVSAL